MADAFFLFFLPQSSSSHATKHNLFCFPLSLFHAYFWLTFKNLFNTVKLTFIFFDLVFVAHTRIHNLHWDLCHFKYLFLISFPFSLQVKFFSLCVLIHQPFCICSMQTTSSNLPSRLMIHFLNLLFYLQSTIACLVGLQPNVKCQTSFTVHTQCELHIDEQKHSHQFQCISTGHYCSSSTIVTRICIDYVRIDQSHVQIIL